MCALGEVGEAFIKGAATAGVSRLGSELDEVVALQAAYGREALAAALARATEFSRSGPLTCAPYSPPARASPVLRPGEALVVDLPKVPRRRLAEYATTAGEVS